jgi:hypothetical protein
MIGTKASTERGRGALNHWRRGGDPITGSPPASRITGIKPSSRKDTRSGEYPGVLVVAVSVFGYLYYQRTSKDITIRIPKVELKN